MPACATPSTLEPLSSSVRESGALECACPICDYRTDQPNPADLGEARGNTQRFLNQTFRLWKCPRCQTIRTLGSVSYPEIYREYALNKRSLDIFARGTLGNLLSRLKHAGLRKSDSILDVGCGNGVLLRYLNSCGFEKVSGYDPYAADFAARPLENARYDCVIANDVIEHVDDPRTFVRHCASWLRPGGLLYIGTSDSDGVDMRNLEPYLMRLHLPFHRTIFTQESLRALACNSGLRIVGSWRRSYMDTLRPFSNYRFLDEFNKALGHNLDRAFDPDAGRVLLRRPWLLIYAFLGYFVPSAYEPAVALRKP